MERERLGEEERQGEEKNTQRDRYKEREKESEREKKRGQVSAHVRARDKTIQKINKGRKRTTG